MPLDSYYASRFRLLAEATGPASTDDEMRVLWRELVRPDTTSRVIPDVTIRDVSIPGPHGPVAVRTYRPTHATIGSALLWVHGGGFRAGDLDMPEAHQVSAALALSAGAFVVSVGYRLAIDGVRYPVPLDDVHAAWKWLCSVGAPDSAGHRVPVAIGGASAGSALALGTALRSRDRGEATGEALLLAYPFVHFPVPALDTSTAREMLDFPEFLRSSADAMERSVANYVGRVTDLPDEALPGMARLTGLPPTVIVVPEYDDLRPSGELLARQLRGAGVPTDVMTARGVLARVPQPHRPAAADR